MQSNRVFLRTHWGVKHSYTYDTVLTKYVEEYTYLYIHIQRAIVDWELIVYVLYLYRYTRQVHFELQSRLPYCWCNFFILFFCVWQAGGPRQFRYVHMQSICNGVGMKVGIIYVLYVGLVEKKKKKKNRDIPTRIGIGNPPARQVHNSDSR